MAIWAIADIHASRLDPATGLPSKPMGIFGPRWENHIERLRNAWRELIGGRDTVIVAGDIDWALHLEDAMETLSLLDSLPGCKILLRGNHDYWWSSKTTNRVRRVLPPSIVALHNNSFQVDGFNVCGAKGSPVPGGADWTDQDAKLLNREQQRLRQSLQTREPGLRTIVALHYPPFYRAHGESPFRTILEEENVDGVVYGHLHAEAASSGPGGCIGGIDYRLVAGDAIGFEPVEVARGGRLLRECRQFTIQRHRSCEASGRQDSGERVMQEPERGHDELRALAEDEIADRRQEVGTESRARELLDIPSESAADLALDQDEEQPPSG
jgi:predicted phosphohydrolase